MIVRRVLSSTNALDMVDLMSKLSGSEDCDSRKGRPLALHLLIRYYYISTNHLDIALSFSPDIWLSLPGPMIPASTVQIADRDRLINAKEPVLH